VRDKAASLLRAVRADLAPSAGEPLRPWLMTRFRWAGWLPYALVTAYAVYLAGFEWHLLLTDLDVPNRMAAAFGITQGLVFALCLSWPVAAWWLSLGMAIAVSLVVSSYGHDVLWPDPVLVAYLSVLAVAGLRVRLRVLVEMWLLTLLAGVILAVALPDLDALTLIYVTVLSGGVLIAAWAVRGRAEALRRLAEQEQVSERERERRALLEERARIARELHDVVAHHMSVVAIQAEAAPYRVPDPPAELTQGFATIRRNALDALNELHRILGLLRNERADDNGADGESAPQPTLDRLEDLVAGVRETGLEVTVETSGSPGVTPPGVGLSAYRIVQEALSNVLRHAPGATAHVQIIYRPDRLELRVINGPSPQVTSPAPSPRAGHGLLGMRERATMLGGHLTAGPRSGGGYAVTAVLPITDPAANSVGDHSTAKGGNT